MKEFPSFVKDGHTYDLNFYDDTVNLYAVQNKLSGIMVSQLIPAANDYVAALGFSDFVSKRKSENDNEIYELICIGILNIQKIKIVDDTRTILFDSRVDLAEWIQAAKDFMISFNDEE